MQLVPVWQLVLYNWPNLFLMNYFQVKAVWGEEKDWLAAKREEKKEAGIGDMLWVLSGKRKGK